MTYIGIILLIKYFIFIARFQGFEVFNKNKTPGLRTFGMCFSNLLTVVFLVCGIFCPSFGMRYFPNCVVATSLRYLTTCTHHGNVIDSSYYIQETQLNIMTENVRIDVCYTDCQQKNRYVQIFCHARIHRATSLTFSGPVYHPMEQLTYKFHVYISNGINFIPPFVTYPYFLHTNHEGKNVF